LEVVAIFWIDPGVSTGLAWGIFNPKEKLVADAMTGRLFSGSATVGSGGHTIPDLHHHAREIYDWWTKFKTEAVVEHCMSPEKVVLGCESYLPRPNMDKNGAKGLFPAFVIGALEAYRLAKFDSYKPMRARHYTPLTLQNPSQGMKYMFRKYLDPWGCWAGVPEHEREAFSHIGAYLMGHMSQPRKVS